MMTREDYERDYAGHQYMREKVKKDIHRLSYHLMPPTGWMNDPNGLCQKDGIYHIYFQYSPYSSGWATKLWGHYSTKDFLHFKEEEPFLFPDAEADRDGVYSGSAIAADGKIHYFYTGNVKLTDQDDYDYINNGREQNTMHVSSEDGRRASKKSLVLSNADYPADMSTHVRDPKVFEHDGYYYMVLGGRTRENRGCALVYVSADLERFEYVNRITTPEPFGYMWECPDMFELDGQQLLAVCPQGLQSGFCVFENVYQSGYFPMEYDFGKQICSLGEFREFDRGFDFYAPQTFEDEKGRRILMAWMGIPDADYHNEPTVAYDWQHCMTMPRVLTWKDGRIYQQPMEEMKKLRREGWTGTLKEAEEQLPCGTCFEMNVDFDKPQEFVLEVRAGAFLSWKDKILSLKLTEGGCGRDSRHVRMEEVRSLSVFSDTSSLEIFVNDGEEVFTTRIYNGEQKQRPAFHTKNSGRLCYYRLAGYEVEAGSWAYTEV